MASSIRISRTQAQALLALYDGLDVDIELSVRQDEAGSANPTLLARCADVDYADFVELRPAPPAIF